MSERCLRVACACLVLVLWGRAAPAVTIELGGPGERPAHSRRAASLDFEVVDDTLILTVTNQSDAAPSGGAWIREIYFDASEDVTGLRLSDPDSGWELSADVPGRGRFGHFDFGLGAGVGRDPDPIPPGGSLVFRFGIEGTGPFEVADFTGAAGTHPPGLAPSVVEVRFVGGPGAHGDLGAPPDPAFLATPEPGSLCLLGLGLAGLLHWRRSGRGAPAGRGALRAPRPARPAG